MSGTVFVVFTHHDVDGGNQETHLFKTKRGAIAWLEGNGYRPHQTGIDVWEKPVYGEWDSEQYRTHSDHYEMETADLYEQVVEE